METLLQIAKRLGIKPNPHMTKEQFEAIHRKICTEFGGDFTWSTLVDALYNKRKKIPQIWNEKNVQKNIEYLKKMVPQGIRVHDQDNFPVKLDEDAIFVWHSARQKGEYYRERFAVSINLDDPKLPTLYMKLDDFIRKHHAAYKIVDFWHIQRTDPLNIYMTKEITPEITRELYGIVGPFLKKKNHAYLDGFSITNNGRVIEGMKYGPEPLLWSEFRGENKNRLVAHITFMLKNLPPQFKQRDLFYNIRDAQSLGQVSANVQYMDLIYYLAGKEGQNPFQLGNQYGLPVGKVSDRYARKYNKKIDIADEGYGPTKTKLKTPKSSTITESKNNVSSRQKKSTSSPVYPTMRDLLNQMQQMCSDARVMSAELSELRQENQQLRQRIESLKKQSSQLKSQNQQLHAKRGISTKGMDV